MRLPCRSELSVPIFIQSRLRMLRSQCCRCCRSIISCCLPGLRVLRSQCCRCCRSIISCCQSGLRMLRSQCCLCCRSIISCCQPWLRMLRSQCCLCCQCCRSLHPIILFQVVVYIHPTPVSPIYCSPSPTKEEEGKKRVLSMCWFSPVCGRLFFFILPHTLHNFSTLPTTKYI